MVMQRWKLTIEYDGAYFHGWQKQDGDLPTVQTHIERAITKFSGQTVGLHVAGRTDAGVHAQGQIAHFDLDDGDRAMNEFEMAKALNALVGSKFISVLKAECVDANFHARFHAKNKLYIYRCLRRTAPPALSNGRVWHLRKDVDVEAMRLAAQNLLGHHDFTSFRATECQAKNPVRTLERADILTSSYDDHGGVEIQFHFEGQSFLHHQVRNMVGTLVHVGLGKFTHSQVKDILAQKDRTKAGPTAPPDGLSLVRIDY
jgi:tRNA pseudouridine38-40 synthase